MSYLSKDPVLVEMAKRFTRFAPFPDSDTFECPETPKHVYTLPGFKLHAVRFCFGGQNRILAYGVTKQRPDLCRFADMISVRFWKWKHRPQPPVDSDLNFSVAGAEQDLADPEMMDEVSLINQIEKHFVDVGVFVERAGNVETRRSVRSAYLESHQEVIDVVVAATERMAETVAGYEKKVNLVFDGMAVVIRRMNSIEGLAVSREKALEGLGDLKTWAEDARKVMEEFRKKPSVDPLGGGHDYTSDQD